MNTNADALGLKQRLQERARTLGFDACGVARVDRPWAAGDRLAAFLEEGRHGSMTWMSAQAHRRAHPQSLWAQAQSAIMLGVNYAPEENPLAGLARTDEGQISAYAKRRDYHDVLKGKIKHLAAWLARETGSEVKVFVDTAPLMEKPLAEAAGLGWQGKHTNLVSREFGSWLLLGAILTDCALAPDAPGADLCGQCRACMDICPTSAFPAPYQLDARRCVAYLTIEHDGPIPHAMREGVGNRVFGCDDCLAICPWNKFAQSAKDAKLAVRSTLNTLGLAHLASLDEGAFRALFSGTPVKRTGRTRFVRNVAIAIGNSRARDLVPAALSLLTDRAPQIRGAAIWALSRLLDAAQFEQLKRDHAGRESDQTVQAEWAPAESK